MASQEPVPNHKLHHRLSERDLCVHLGQCLEDIKVDTPVNLSAAALVWNCQASPVIIFNTGGTCLVIVAIKFAFPVNLRKIQWNIDLNIGLQ